MIRVARLNPFLSVFDLFVLGSVGPLHSRLFDLSVLADAEKTFPSWTCTDSDWMLTNVDTLGPSLSVFVPT